MDKGYIAPATIVNGKVLVNHIIIFVDDRLCNISPFNGEVANTAYKDGVIIVADNAMLSYISELELVAGRYLSEDIIAMANGLCDYILDSGCVEFNKKIGVAHRLLYVNMEDGRVDILQ
ncbi:MAG: hypothetical protein R3Y22_01745 [Bacteroidales bacterium]